MEVGTPVIPSRASRSSARSSPPPPGRGRRQAVGRRAAGGRAPRLLRAQAHPRPRGPTSPDVQPDHPCRCLECWGDRRAPRHPRAPCRGCGAPSTGVSTSPRSSTSRPGSGAGTGVLHDDARAAVVRHHGRGPHRRRARRTGSPRSRPAPGWRGSSASWCAPVPSRDGRVAVDLAPGAAAHPDAATSTACRRRRTVRATTRSGRWSPSLLGDLHRQPRPRHLPRLAGPDRLGAAPATRTWTGCLALEEWTGGPWSVPGEPAGAATRAGSCGRRCAGSRCWPPRSPAPPTGGWSRTVSRTPPTCSAPRTARGSSTGRPSRWPPASATCARCWASAEGDEPWYAYLEAGGRPEPLSPDTVELFALQWHLSGIAEQAVLFSGPRLGTPPTSSAASATSRSRSAPCWPAGSWQGPARRPVGPAGERHVRCLVLRRRGGDLRRRRRTGRRRRARPSPRQVHSSPLGGGRSQLERRAGAERGARRRPRCVEVVHEVGHARSVSSPDRPARQPDCPLTRLAHEQSAVRRRLAVRQRPAPHRPRGRFRRALRRLQPLHADGRARRADGLRAPTSTAPRSWSPPTRRASPPASWPTATTG